MVRSSVGRRVLAGAGGAIALAMAIGWPAFGQQSNAQPAGPPSGYLGAAAPDEKIFLPPPPSDKSVAGKADLAIFRATRSQKDSPRWQLASRDAAVDPASILDGFGCALGARLRLSDMPAFARLMQRTMADAGPLIGPSKERYQRPRPFLRAKGPVCTPLTPEFSKSGSYPSGHSTVGWVYALVLTELVPDRSSELLARGRVFGESRVVCGVHYASDVEAGYTLASGLVAALDANPGFRADLEAARAELDQARKQAPAPDAAECAIEKEASAKRPW
jgi:acid phosphatase (class A)